MYLPHGLWKVLAGSGRLKGPRDGNVLTFGNVGRKLSGTEFITLVAGSWVGTTISQSASLEAMIRSVLASGRTVTFAVKRRPPPAAEAAIDILPELDEGETLRPEEALLKITN
jgi:hypothetical protein